MRREIDIRVVLLIVVAIGLLGGVLLLSVQTLPAPPHSPTPTFPEGIDFPNGRSVPQR